MNARSFPWQYSDKVMRQFYRKAVWVILSQSFRVSNSAGERSGVWWCRSWCVNSNSTMLQAWLSCGFTHALSQWTVGLPVAQYSRLDSTEHFSLFHSNVRLSGPANAVVQRHSRLWSSQTDNTRRCVSHAPGLLSFHVTAYFGRRVGWSVELASLSLEKKGTKQTRKPESEFEFETRAGPARTRLK